MFKLFKLNDDKYLILQGKIEIEGNEIVIINALLLMDVTIDEILYGLSALEHDDMAEYGINKTFIFSKKLTKTA